MPTVIVESPALPAPGRVPFEQALSIGRCPNSDLQILDGRISKQHAVLRSNGEQFLVEDLGSRNGTFLNGKRILVPSQLGNGDVVQVGDSRLTFEHHPVDESSARKRTSTTTMQIRKREVRHDFPPANQVGSPEMLSEDYDRLRLAWRLSLEIGFDRPLRDQADRIVDLLIQEFDADRGVLMLFPRGTADRSDPENLRPIGVVTRKGDPKESVRVPRTVLRAVLEQRKGVLAADARSDARFDTSKSVILQGIRSALCVPLTARSGNLVGVLALDATRVVNTFHEKDLIVLETVGVQIATAIENTLLVEQMREQAVARERLSRLLSPNLVEEVVSGQLKFTQAGEIRHVTILFTDMRGFTAMSQRFGPAEVLRLLNSYFGMAVNILFRHEGTLDKFMGDGMMALFGAPIHQPDAPIRAVRAATEIQAAVRDWNLELVKAGHEQIHIGIGIASGPVVAGAMGSTQTMSYTVVGPAVNLASRLCAVAGQGEILICSTIRGLVAEEVPVGAPRMVKLKGYADPVPAHPVTI
jgi:adenylate cyclase